MSGKPVHPRFDLLSRIVHTASFLVERAEEGGERWRGHTEPLRWMAPRSFTPQVARDFQHDVIQAAALGPAEAALALRGRLVDEPGHASALPSEQEVEDACGSLDRPYQVVSWQDFDARRDRAIVRGVRYIWQIHTIEARQHSRVFESFVPDALIPRGRSSTASKAAGVHREHVVPCCELLLLCQRAFKQWPGDVGVLAPPTLVRELADAVRSLLAIVEISHAQVQSLDAGVGAAETKWKMPAGWVRGRSCVFQRLHDVDIDFQMLPPGDGRSQHVACTCERARQ